MVTERDIDLTGLKCPMPIVQLTKLIRELDAGEEFTAHADDPAFCLDVEAWCKKTGQTLIRIEETDGRLIARIRKTH